MGKRKTDWEAIKREWRAGQLSIKEIARQHGISDAAIHQKKNRDKKNGKPWGERDLSSQVRKRVNAKVISVSEDVSANNVSEDEIIEQAAERGKDVIMLHRKDIKALRQLEAQLIDEIIGKPKKLYITQYQGNIVQKEVGLTAAERSLAANNLANVQHKRIQLERQAFNLDDNKGGSPLRDLETLMEEIAAESNGAADLVGHGCK